MMKKVIMPSPGELWKARMHLTAKQPGEQTKFFPIKANTIVLVVSVNVTYENNTKTIITTVLLEDGIATITSFDQYHARHWTNLFRKLY